MTQADAARLLNVGSPRSGKSMISQFEHGRRVPGPQVIAGYVKHLGGDAAVLAELVAAATASTPGTDRNEAEQSSGAKPQRGPHNTPDTGRANDGSRWTGRRVTVWASLTAAALVTLTVIGILVTTRDEPRPGKVLTPVTSAELVFDALGSRADQTIHVYPGPSASSADRRSDLDFVSGEKTDVICLTQGRRVTSDPSAGERSKSSDIWARIRTNTGLIRYATMTYARISPAIAKVPYCEHQ